MIISDTKPIRRDRIKTFPKHYKEPIGVACLITPWNANSSFLSAMDREPVLEFQLSIN